MRTFQEGAATKLYTKEIFSGARNTAANYCYYNSFFCKEELRRLRESAAAVHPPGRVRWERKGYVIVMVRLQWLRLFQRQPLEPLLWEKVLFYLDHYVGAMRQKQLQLNNHARRHTHLWEAVQCPADGPPTLPKGVLKCRIAQNYFCNDHIISGIVLVSSQISWFRISSQATFLNDCAISNTHPQKRAYLLSTLVQ